MHQPKGSNAQLLIIATVINRLTPTVICSTLPAGNGSQGRITEPQEITMSTDSISNINMDYATTAAPSIWTHDLESGVYNRRSTSDWDVFTTGKNSFRNDTQNNSSNSVLLPCNGDVEDVCKGKFCNQSENTCTLPGPPAHGVFVIERGVEVDGCVGVGETVFLVCDEGYEVVKGSSMSVTEFLCLPSGTLAIWKGNLCVPVKCELPEDWLVFTELELEKTKGVLLFLPDTQLRIKCWLEDIQINWSYLLHCKNNGIWEGMEALSRSDCQKPKPEPDILYNALEDEATLSVGQGSALSNQIQILSLTMSCLMISSSAE